MNQFGLESATSKKKKVNKKMINNQFMVENIWTLNPNPVIIKSTQIF